MAEIDDLRVLRRPEHPRKEPAVAESLSPLSAPARPVADDLDRPREHRLARALALALPAGLAAWGLIALPILLSVE